MKENVWKLQKMMIEILTNLGHHKAEVQHMAKARNYISKPHYNEVRNILKASDWVLRRGDRDQRWILVPKSWETREFERIKEKLRLNKVSSDTVHGHVYFLPKGKKEGK
jgi:hypothetical protein